jgi:hypothetical protein
MSGDSPQLNPSGDSPFRRPQRLLTAAGGRPVTVEMIEADVADRRSDER